jgi:hypothetical protein
MRVYNRRPGVLQALCAWLLCASTIAALDDNVVRVSVLAPQNTTYAYTLQDHFLLFALEAPSWLLSNTTIRHDPTGIILPGVNGVSFNWTIHNATTGALRRGGGASFIQPYPASVAPSGPWYDKTTEDDTPDGFRQNAERYALRPGKQRLNWTLGITPNVFAADGRRVDCEEIILHGTMFFSVASTGRNVSDISFPLPTDTDGCVSSFGGLKATRPTQDGQCPRAEPLVVTTPCGGRGMLNQQEAEGLITHPNFSKSPECEDDRLELCRMATTTTTRPSATSAANTGTLGATSPATSTSAADATRRTGVPALGALWAMGLPMLLF